MADLTRTCWLVRVVPGRDITAPSGHTSSRCSSIRELPSGRAEVNPGHRHWYRRELVGEDRRGTIVLPAQMSARGPNREILAARICCLKLLQATMRACGRFSERGAFDRTDALPARRHCRRQSLHLYRRGDPGLIGVATMRADGASRQPLGFRPVASLVGVEKNLVA
jgi:hypothetical protein